MKRKIISHRWLVLLALTLSPLTVRATSSAPPGQFSYQGFLTDASGIPLATNAPKNYTIDFKIYPGSTGVTPKWGERQTVTVDRGYFTVILGNGTAIDGNTPNSSDLSPVFSGPDASDRYIGITVRELSATEIAPRLRLLPSPYSFLATSATKLVSGGGADLITSSANNVTVAGSITATSLSGSGALLTALNASQITTGTLPDARLSANPVVTGTLRASSFTGSGAGLTNLNGASLNNGSVDVNKLVAQVKEALCPPGTILPYAGDTAPAGWLLCNGAYFYRYDYPNLYAVITTRFGNYPGQPDFPYLPDLRGRFLRGRDEGTGRDPDRASRTAMANGGATGDAVGSVQGDQLKAHSHALQYTVYGGFDHGDDSASGSWGEVYVGYPVAATLNFGGNETRPVNAYVNYIIKY